MGFAVCKECEVELLTSKAKAKRLPYVVLEHFFEEHKDVGVANDGKTKDLFDMEALVATYELFDKALGEFEFDYWTRKQLLKNNKTLADYSEGYDYANPYTYHELITVGLILGYPIPSTVAANYEYIKGFGRG